MIQERRSRESTEREARFCTDEATMPSNEAKESETWNGFETTK